MKRVPVLALMLVVAAGSYAAKKEPMSPQQYVDSLNLVGQPSSQAYATLTRAGFACRLASGRCV
jgi:hypothetical protein